MFKIGHVHLLHIVSNIYLHQGGYVIVVICLSPC